MPNRGQQQDRSNQQRQPGNRNPDKLAPGEDEAPETDESPLGAQPKPGRKGQQPGNDPDAPSIDYENENEEGDDDEDEKDGLGARQ